MPDGAEAAWVRLVLSQPFDFLRPRVGRAAGATRVVAWPDRRMGVVFVFDSGDATFWFTHEPYTHMQETGALLNSVMVLVGDKLGLYKTGEYSSRVDPPSQKARPAKRSVLAAPTRR